MDKQATDTRKCPQCQSDVSIKTKKCPHCRSKIPQPVPKWMVIGVILSTISLVALGSLGSDSSYTSNVSQENPKEWASIYPQILVKQMLKSPSTAKFCSADVTDLGNNKYEVVSCVDSQNSYGAMIRSYWKATVTYSGSNPENSASWTFDKITFDGKVIYQK